MGSLQEDEEVDVGEDREGSNAAALELMNEEDKGRAKREGVG